MLAGWTLHARTQNNEDANTLVALERELEKESCHDVNGRSSWLDAKNRHRRQWKCLFCCASLVTRSRKIAFQSIIPSRMARRICIESGAKWSTSINRDATLRKIIYLIDTARINIHCVQMNLYSIEIHTYLNKIYLYLLTARQINHISGCAQINNHS